MQQTCQQFGSHFPKKSLLLQHQRQTMHINSIDCKISICNKKFERKHNLDRHMVRNRDKFLFQCCECGTLFPRQDHLDRHIQQYHNQIGRGQIVHVIICDQSVAFVVFLSLGMFYHKI